MDMPRLTDQRAYPAGVPSWIDVATSDPSASAEFYGGFFGWTFEDAVPAGAPGSYLIARLDGHDVAALRPEENEVGWMSYIAADDVDALARRVQDAGGEVVDGPADVGKAGRGATFRDPEGAEFRGWQGGTRLGAQVVNVPGAWNFSYLHTPHRERSLEFYRSVFGWAVDADLGAGMIRLPGYGDHLASTIDPDIHERQAFAPEGFADVIAGLIDEPAGTARWSIAFTVANRDQAVERATALGAQVRSTTDDEWTEQAELVDTSGSAFVVSALIKTE